jgi:hypothetical protein
MFETPLKYCSMQYYYKISISIFDLSKERFRLDLSVIPSSWSKIIVLSLPLKEAVVDQNKMTEDDDNDDNDNKYKVRQAKQS